MDGREPPCQRHTAPALAGASAGVNVLQSGARPGSENVSVLKDAASCAIYGNRGANGVVLVTTKNPQRDNFSIQYSGLLSINKPAHHFSTMSDNAAYMELINESADNVGVNRPYSQSIIDLWREKSKYPDEISESGYPNRVAYPNTDWMDAMFDKGRVFQRHNLSASGRTGGTAYLISLSYVDNPGIMQGMGAKKYQARANITSRLNRVVEIGTRMWGFHRSRDLNDFDGASRYLFEANLRHDGSSRFAQRSRWGTFPSVSAGWRLSEETFMQGLSPVLSNAKLRASWGKLGNSSIGNYEYLATYATGFDYVFGNKVSGGSVASLNNDLLGWEETASTDIGVDLGFFNNRLTIEADWYNRHTSGILYRAPIHLTVGVKDPPFQNLCEMSNRGVELTAAWHHRVGKVNYSVSANFTRNYNKVSSYRGPLEAGWVTDENGFRTYYSNIGEVSTKIDAQRRTIEGRLINEYYLLTPYCGDGTHRFADGSVNPAGGPRDGMIRTEADLQWVRDMTANDNVFLPNRSVDKKGIWYGDYIYADVNGDGVYGNDNDYTFQNLSKTPKYFYGLQASAQWNGFDFSMQWAGAGGFATYWYWLGFNSTATRKDLNIPSHIAADHYFYDPDSPNNPKFPPDGAAPRSEVPLGHTIQILYKMTYRLIHLAALSALVSLSACSEETPVNPGLHPGEPTALTLTPMAQLNAATADINSGAADCSSASLMMDGRSLCVLGPDELGMDRVHYPRRAPMPAASFCSSSSRTRRHRTPIRCGRPT